MATGIKIDNQNASPLYRDYDVETPATPKFHSVITKGVTTANGSLPSMPKNVCDFNNLVYRLERNSTNQERVENEIIELEANPNMKKIAIARNVVLGVLATALLVGLVALVPLTIVGIIGIKFVGIVVVGVWFGGSGSGALLVYALSELHALIRNFNKDSTTMLEPWTAEAQQMIEHLRSEEGSRLLQDVENYCEQEFIEAGYINPSTARKVNERRHNRAVDIKENLNAVRKYLDRVG